MSMITQSTPCNKTLTCPKGQSAWAVAPPCLAKKKTRSVQDKLNSVFRSVLLSLEVMWACICARKELRFTQDECVVQLSIS